MEGCTINYKGKQYLVIDLDFRGGIVRYCLSNLETLRTTWVQEEELSIIEPIEVEIDEELEL